MVDNFLQNSSTERWPLITALLSERILSALENPSRYLESIKL